MKFPSKKIIPRYVLVAVVLVIMCLAVLVRTAEIMFFQRDFWLAVSDRFVKNNQLTEPIRGNIFSSDGQLMASSLPEYKLYMDFMSGERDSLRRIKDQARRDSLLNAKMDSICQGLHHLLPDRSAEWFRQNLLRGRARESRDWLIYPNRVSYIQYKEAKKLPLFRLNKYSGGFHTQAFDRRKNPFGSLALRTLGDLYGGKDSARCGLELGFDSLLRGQPGISHRQKVKNHYLSIVDKPAIDGYDLVTTLDVEIQDIAEKALVDKLEELKRENKGTPQVGVAIVMEVATGDVKAIVNMTHCSDGHYREVRNDAVSDLLEPGSVFKPVSFLVAFNDGYIKMTDRVETGMGVKEMYGRKMKDHNWNRGGYGLITVPECLEYSSNIGVSTLIDRYYHNNPQKFVQGVYNTGLHEDLHLPIPGYARPRIRMPRRDGSNWSKTALPWMSIGYETQIPPISTLTFYNGIANNGRMMRPRFVKALKRGDEVVKIYDPVVVREHMASTEAVRNLQTCLNWVVAKGLGKRAGSHLFPVSGKTGTAQLWTATGFSARYLISFAGYFPSDKPLYSCIVCIQKPLPASGGTMCGPVFKRIAESIMARRTHPRIEDARDTLAPRLPQVKAGDVKAARTVARNLGLPYKWRGDDAAHWGRIFTEGEALQIEAHEKTAAGLPDVTGMGLRDAVFALEKLGLNVRVSGRGHVVKQSPEKNTKYRSGQTVYLHLSNEREHHGEPSHIAPLPTEGPTDGDSTTRKKHSDTLRQTTRRKTATPASPATTNSKNKKTTSA